LQHQAHGIMPFSLFPYLCAATWAMVAILVILTVSLIIAYIKCNSEQYGRNTKIRKSGMDADYLGRLRFLLRAARDIRKKQWEYRTRKDTC
jgi:hypothetical protein